MPFTGSHPAAVLPLLRTRLPASALVIGSVAPDLPYFVPLRLGEFYPPVSLGVPTHTAWALVSLDLLIGLLAWAVWHGVFAAPLVAMAPARLRARLAGRLHIGLRRRPAAVRDRGLVVLALVIGSATHVGWDEFTHVDRWGSRHIAALSTTWMGLEGYRWAQYAGGVLGALALVIWAVAWWRRTPADSTLDGLSGAAPRPPWFAMTAVVAAGAVVGFWSALTADGLRPAMFFGATRGGAAALGVALMLSLLWHGNRFLGRR
jgi:hypothetical protein